MMAFVTVLALYRPPGAPKAPPGSWWNLLGVLLFLLPLAAAAAVVVTCALLIPIHHLLVRLRFRSHILYQVAMLAIVLASYYVFTAGQEWSLAFTIPFAAVPGAFVFRHFAYTVRPVPHGKPEALMVFLWAVVITAYHNMYIIRVHPSEVRAVGEVYRLWIWYGMPAMTLLALTALFARAWSRRVMAALSYVGLATAMVFAVAFLIALLPLRLAANDCSFGVHRRLKPGDRSNGPQEQSDRGGVEAGKFFECYPVWSRNAG
jgi:hypothetical protein